MRCLQQQLRRQNRTLETALLASEKSIKAPCKQLCRDSMLLSSGSCKPGQNVRLLLTMLISSISCPRSLHVCAVSVNISLQHTACCCRGDVQQFMLVDCSNESTVRHIGASSYRHYWNSSHHRLWALPQAVYCRPAGLQWNRLAVQLQAELTMMKQGRLHDLQGKRFTSFCHSQARNLVSSFMAVGPCHDKQSHLHTAAALPNQQVNCFVMQVQAAT